MDQADVEPGREQAGRWGARDAIGSAEVRREAKWQLQRLMQVNQAAMPLWLHECYVGYKVCGLAWVSSPLREELRTERDRLLLRA